MRIKGQEVSNSISVEAKDQKQCPETINFRVQAHKRSNQVKGHMVI